MVKSRAIEDLLAQFPREEEFPLDDEVSGEMATTEVTREQWVMKFDGCSITNLRGTGVILYHEGEETMALSLKLEFSCSNNTTKYEAYLTELAIALEMGIKHLKVIGDSNLVVCQANESFSLKESSLALYRTLPRKWKKCSLHLG